MYIPIQVRSAKIDIASVWDLFETAATWPVHWISALLCCGKPDPDRKTGVPRSLEYWISSHFLC